MKYRRDIPTIHARGGLSIIGCTVCAYSCSVVGREGVVDCASSSVTSTSSSRAPVSAVELGSSVAV